MAKQRAWEYMVTSIDIFASARFFGGVSLKNSVGFLGKDAGAPNFDDPQGSSVPWSSYFHHFSFSVYLVYNC